MRQSVLRLLSASLVLVPALASADPARLNNPAPPAPAPAPAPAPPPAYDAPPTVQPGYNAPPPVTGYNPQPVAQPQPVMMSQPQPYAPRPAVVTPPPPPGRQGLFVGVLGGAAIPLVGSYSDYLGTGFMAYGQLGWATPSGISVRAELGARSNGYVDSPGVSSTSILYGAALRWTAPRGTFRPFLEGIVDAFSVLGVTTTDDFTGMTTTTPGGTGVSVGAAAGGELELGTNFALELCVRYDHVVLSPATDALDTGGGYLSVLGGGSYYF